MKISALGSNHFIRVAGVASLALGTFIAVACADDPKPPIDVGSGHTGGSSNTGGSQNLGGSDNPGGSSNTGGSADGGTSNTGGTSDGGSTGEGGAGGEGLGGETGTGGDPATGGAGTGGAGTGGDPGTGGTGGSGGAGTGGTGGGSSGPTNLVSNGAFESGSSGWFSWGAGAVLAQTTARAHGGTGSLGLTGRADNGPIATSLTSLVVPGKSYQLSFYVSVDKHEVTADAKVNITRKLQCVGDAEADYTWVGPQVTLTNSDWVQITGAFTVPATCELVDASMFAEGPPAGVDLFIDDVTLYEQ